MRKNLRLSKGDRLAAGLVLALAGSTGIAEGKALSVLYSFKGGSDGAGPSSAALVADKVGNLYGTTFEGGGSGCGGSGCGTVYKLTPKGVETILHLFSGSPDGANPESTLLADKNGNLYGTTTAGGTGGAGTVFEVSESGTETVLYSFTGGNDGAYPYAGLIADKNGNLFGTTSEGGTNTFGTVFELAPNGSETVLHSFSGTGDGGLPFDGLIADKEGNFYGTTALGGAFENCLPGCGTVFKVAPNGIETVLYSFLGGKDGVNPEAALLMDKLGNLYGTTAEGGGGECKRVGCGIAFELAPNGTEKLLHTFLGGDSDGAEPLAALIGDKKGNLYGTTFQGEGTGCGGAGCGTAFKLTPKGTETILHIFTGGKDGGGPDSSLIANAKGQLFGTAYQGGVYGYGTVFEVKE